MRKVLSIVICGALAACAGHSEKEWEEPQIISEDIVYIENEDSSELIIENFVDDDVNIDESNESNEIIETKVISKPAPNSPRTKKTKKIITTTTVTESPCRKEVCEPVVTVTEEIINLDDEIMILEETSMNVSQEVINRPRRDRRPSPKPILSEEKKEIENTVEVVVEVEKEDMKIISLQNADSKKQEVSSSYSPDVYKVIASRAVNRMLSDTSAIYDTGAKKKLYINDAQLLSTDLPYGSHVAKGTTKSMITGAKTFDVVYNQKDADFTLDILIDWYVANDNAAPALQYKLMMLDSKNTLVNQWIEIIRHIQE